jgi:hypothetical protein
MCWPLNKNDANRTPWRDPNAGMTPLRAIKVRG